MIDYIGNHRVFLHKTRALFDLGNADREVAFALERLEAGTLEFQRWEGERPITVWWRMEEAMPEGL